MKVKFIDKVDNDIETGIWFMINDCEFGYITNKETDDKQCILSCDNLSIEIDKVIGEKIYDYLKQIHNTKVELFKFLTSNKLEIK